MFATLLEPGAFAATVDEQVEVVRRLGGPFFAENPADLAVARKFGLQTALLVRGPLDPSRAERVAADARAGSVDLVAIRTTALSKDQSARETSEAALLSLLNAVAGYHRMLIAVDAPIAERSVAGWQSLPMESLLFDPIADPDGWRAAATLPGTCGLALALVGGAGHAAVAREALLWGLRYAASLGGRGGLRVGFTERPLAGAGFQPRRRDEADAAAVVAAASELLRLAGSDRETLERELDPRSFSPAARRTASRRRSPRP